ncbi:TRAP transporter substrate-binding protein [Sagittula sp. SSi028]|uniref:TRAP transporter substrate-binding protein n=1 Tax=Sagittula sp. SSi028 TaxID=3400636 RepID=UPI003AF8BFC5
MDRRSFLRASTVGAGAAAASSLAAPALAQGQRTLTMVTSVPHGFAVFDDAAVYFAEAVNAMSGGSLTIDKKAAGELVGGFEVFDAVSSGQADCYHSADYYFGGNHPGFYYFTAVPFGATATELSTWYYQDGGIELHHQLGEIFNLKSFLTGTTGLQPGGWFRKEINSADDFNGLKFRMPGLGGQALGNTGASVQSIPGGEIYQALSSGAIDGAEWIGPFADERLGFQEVCDYYYTAGFHEPGSALCAAFNLDVWNDLSDQHRKIIEIASIATTQWSHTQGIANNGAALKRIESQGVKLMQFGDDVWDLFGRASVEAMDSYMDDPMYAEIRGSFEDSLKKSSEWIQRSDAAYVAQRERVLRA